MFMRNLFLCAFALVCLSEAANAFNCYKCNSRDNKNCARSTFKADAVPKVECVDKTRSFTGDWKHVKSQCSTILRIENGEETWVRGCYEDTPDDVNVAVKDRADACMEWKKDFAPGTRFTKCENCDGNLCNSAQSRYATIGATFVLLVAGVFFF